MNTRRAGTRRFLPGSPFNPVPGSEPVPEEFEVDDRVTHDRHGMGRVVSVEERAVVIDFGTGPRRIALPNPKLSKL